MSMAPTTEQQASRSDLGQRFFMLGVFATLAVEVVLTVSNVGLWFEWTSCVLGIVASVGILYLGNWLWSGDRTALTAMRVWVGVMLVLAIVAMALHIAGDTTVPTHLGINIAWQGWLKLAVYALLASLLLLPGPTLEFFATQRGETATTATEAAPPTAAPSGPPVELAADQAKALDGLGGAMKMASGVVMLVGVIEWVVGLVNVASGTSAVLNVIEGIALTALGVLLLAPAKALQALLDARPRGLGLVITFLMRLVDTYRAYAVIFLALAAVAVCRVVLK